jgi:hypothetical protein
VNAVLPLKPLLNRSEPIFPARRENKVATLGGENFGERFADAR